MKLVKIFGIVVALHVVLLTFFFLSPGCQSSPSTPATATTADAIRTADQPAPAAAAENWSNQPAAPSAYPASTSYAATMPPGAGDPPPITNASGADRTRVAPSRPDNPDAYLSAGSTPAVLAESTNPGSQAEHTIVSGDTLGRIARKYGTSVRELQKLNPRVRADALRVGQIIKVPGSASSTAARSTSSSNRVISSDPMAPVPGVSSAASTATYTVKAGDSLSKIAARNGTTVTALRSANHLTGDTIHIGEVLKIPGVAPAAVSTPPPGGAPSGAPTMSPPSASSNLTHIVRHGEMLSTIAKQYDVSVQEIMKVNKITDVRKIRVGQSLVIPRHAVAATTPAPTLPSNVATLPAAPDSPSNPTQNPPTQNSPTNDLDSLGGPTTGEAPPAIPVDEPTPQP